MASYYPVMLVGKGFPSLWFMGENDAFFEDKTSAQCQIMKKGIMANLESHDCVDITNLQLLDNA